MTFAELIKAARADAGLTQAALHQILGIPLRTIESWEGGHRTPPEWIQRLVINAIEEIKK